LKYHYCLVSSVGFVKWMDFDVSSILNPLAASQYVVAMCEEALNFRSETQLLTTQLEQSERLANEAHINWHHERTNANDHFRKQVFSSSC
jgi:hypothetical protein